MPRSKFHSSSDLRNFAQEYKNQLYNQFQNQIMNENATKFNINYNINQNINHNVGQVTFNNYNGGNKWSDYNSGNNSFQNEPIKFSPIRNLLNSNSSHVSDYPDSENTSLIEGCNNLNFISLRPTPKRNQSTGHLDTKAVSQKPKASLFMSNEVDKGDEFENLDELMKSITCNLWDYAKTQKGSRNLQKLLNKIEQEELDKILNECKNNFKDLMTNIYGNYFCQKLIQCCSSDQRMFILRNVYICFNFR